MERNHFFAYFPVAPDPGRWEICATSFGHIQMAEGETRYPPDQHPSGHHFGWEEGRRLSEFQMLTLHSGCGQFEGETGGPVRLRPGSTLLLHPGVWHRYRPDPGTGWTESWIGLHGPVLDRLIQSGLLSASRPVVAAGRWHEWEEAWERACEVAWHKPPGFPVRLGLLALELLHRLVEEPDARPVTDRMTEIVARAQTLYSQGQAEEISGPGMASQLGMGYSHFRRGFKKQTGLSPKQYQNEVRYRRVRDLLVNTALSVKEIAERTGYSSPYHLTKDFTRRAGSAPSIWRLAARSE